MRNSLLLIVVFVLSFGCRQILPKQADNQVNPKPYITQEGDKVIFLGDHYADYLKSIRSDYKHKDSLCYAKINIPIHNKYFSNAEYMLNRPNSFIIKDTIGLESTVNSIESNKEIMVSLITDALTECRKYLKNDSITFCIAPSIDDERGLIKKMGGVSAWTLGSKVVCIIIDPMVTGWASMLPNCIAHEYNHAYWCKKYYTKSYAWTLLNTLISEGRADSYAHLLYPTVKCPWDSALTEEGKMALWNRIKPDLQKADGTIYTEVMFGSTQDTIEAYPKWGGYTLGYSIVQSALKSNPSLTPVQLSALSADTVLAMSDYKMK